MCPFWVEPVQKENGARTKVYCPFWVAAGGGVGSRLDLLKGISYNSYNNGGNMNTEQVILNLAFIGAVLSILVILNTFSGGLLW